MKYNELVAMFKGNDCPEINYDVCGWMFWGERYLSATQQEQVIEFIMEIVMDEHQDLSYLSVDDIPVDLRDGIDSDYFDSYADYIYDEIKTEPEYPQDSLSSMEEKMNQDLRNAYPYGENSLI